MNVPDNYDAFCRHEARQEAELQKLPVCCFCDEPIQSEDCYLIYGDFVCPDCLKEHFWHSTSDFLEE